MTAFAWFYATIVATCLAMILYGRPAFALTGALLFLFFHAAIAVFAAWWRASGRAAVPPSFSRRSPSARQRCRKAAVATILDDTR